MIFGSGMDGELTFIDIVSLISFWVGLENYASNISQEDVQKTADAILNEIHAHLEMQDNKIEHIIEVLHESYQISVRED